ncbi:putative cytochrome P450 family protein [Aspergillus udagawae]|nr:putative cytochrome P450 family protein [Aspergillus udagawae]
MSYTDNDALHFLATSLAVFIALYTLIHSIISKSIQEAAQQPPWLPESGWLGLRAMRQSLQADRTQTFLALQSERFAKMNRMTYRTRFLHRFAIHTCDPRNIQAVLGTQFNDFGLGPVRRANFRPLLGDGIFTADGPYWKHSRALLRPSFARDQISDLDLEERHVQNLLCALPVCHDGSRWTGPVDLQPLFFRLTLDSATEFLFGHSVDSQLTALLAENAASDGASGREASFARALNTAQQSLATRGRLQELYWLHNPASFRESCADVHSFVDGFVQIALERASSPETHLGEKGAEEEAKEKDKGKKYVFLDELARQTRDPVELRSQLLNILLAGRDTTASFLGWTFYLLARHQTIFYKLRQIVLRDFGTFDQPTEITFARLHACKYLQWVNRETLRLFPVVPVNARRALKDTSLPVGGGADGLSKIFIRKGQVINYSVHVMHRHRDLWGANADEFVPERWDKRQSGWDYLPFNGGARICLGQKFALTNASYVIVRLLQRFEAIENVDSETETKHHLTLTDCSGTGVQIRLQTATS